MAELSVTCFSLREFDSRYPGQDVGYEFGRFLLKQTGGRDVDCTPVRPFAGFLRLSVAADGLAERLRKRIYDAAL